MGQKEEFLQDYTSGRFEGCDRKALEFIAEVLFHECPGIDDEVCQEVITDLFSNGYCYYFACMMAIELGYGEVRWLRGYGHIMWTYNGIPYEIYGIYDDVGPEGMVSLSELNGMLGAFMHVPSNEPEAFINRIKHRGTPDNTLIYPVVVESLFSGRLSYHFACLLQIAYTRGDVLEENNGWVFADVDGRKYNIYGEIRNG